ncbi:MAG TPA: hypothetical protein VK633_07395, partial [Verrucomicrobiae bacterium]|nr:hypothetical protein [Verrucomicrobiae bacterium]
WELYKREAKTRGVALDWAAFVPPPVPDDQNFFKAPKMESWFTGRNGSELSKRIGFQNWHRFLLERSLIPFGEIKVVAPSARIAPEDADLVLRYNPPVLITEKGTTGEVSQAIKNWLKSKVDFDNKSESELSQVSQVIGQPLILKALEPVAPMRVAVRSERVPSEEELKQAFSIPITRSGLNSPSVISTGNESFRVSLGAAPFIPAAEYIEWSQQFNADFDVMRAALKRPYARIDGDYQHTPAIPTANLIACRTVAQILAVRTQCYLLQGKPDKALHEVTLLHDLFRFLESRPMTLVSAMINVAIKGLYVTTMADGLRLRAWREPQLAAIQEQLGQINLMPQVYRAFQSELAGFYRLMETSTSRELAAIFANHAEATTWKKITNPTYQFLTFAPQGWIYQNAVRVLSLQEKPLAGFDLEHHLIRPKITDNQIRETIDTIERSSIYNFLSGVVIPHYGRAMQKAAQNQTLANEAYIICGLERYHSAHGKYPEALAALVPQFAAALPKDIIGGGALKYRVEEGQFVIYSIGWNETDDGGMPGLKSDGSGDLAKNDWVWPYQELK